MASPQPPSGDPLVPESGPELIIGLVAPIGVDPSFVIQRLKFELETVNYHVKEVRLSSLIHALDDYSHLSKSSSGSEFDRIKEHMEAGTAIRNRTGRGDTIALLAIAEIRRLRQEFHWGKNHEKAGVENAEGLARNPLPRTVYILNSLKHPHEIDLLRDVYGQAFFVVSVYSPRETRVEFLARRIADSENTTNAQSFRSNAEKLICIDEEEEGELLGQNVSEAFPLADLFVVSTSSQNGATSIKRFVELLFRNPFHTPTIDEYVMFHAKSSALRSADLSRQVGAAIASAEGEILAVGCNEVPKAGGGAYWPDDENDARDFRVGHDSSEGLKRRTISELLEILNGRELLKEGEAEPDVKDLVSTLLQDRAFRQTRIRNIIEYGRAVHAEMDALIHAARAGISVRGCMLYTTTFPCHLCAKHIIAAGIRKVVYIEPYPKSLVQDLYKDSVVIDPIEPCNNRVTFQSFVGIAPRRYMRMFESSEKKKDSTGKIVPWSPRNAEPRLKRFVLSYIDIEQRAVAETLPSALKAGNMRPIDQPTGDGA